MAERSTATSPPQRSAKIDSTAPSELHSGHKLANRYRLEECITRLDGFSSWRAVDEKLRRAVGVHVLPATHDRASAVLAAARSAALLADPRFVQVLDAVEDDTQVHVVHEWLPDAVPLATLLQAGPLDAHEAYVLASQVSEALAAAHEAGLSHLRLTPATVLRAGPSQYRIRGLAVDAALRGITSSDPQRADTEAIGALLYAALTQRWPYPEGAYGLDGVIQAKGHPAAPEQVRAGVHRGLSELAMRALSNDGATATTALPACTTPAELASELAKLPRIPPPDPTPSELPSLQRGAGRPAARPAPGTRPATLQGRTGTALKWGVSALLIVALSLGSWQLADALMTGDSSPDPEPSATPSQQAVPSPQPVTIKQVTDFDPYDDTGEENADAVNAAIDGDPTTAWHTKNYYGPGFGNLKPGVGLVLDLGDVQRVSTLNVEALGDTTIQFRAADPAATTMPASEDGYRLLAEGTGESLTLQADKAVETRFVLVWLTELPMGNDGNYRGRIANIAVSG